MASTVIQHFDVQTYDIYRSRFKQLSGGYYSDILLHYYLFSQAKAREFFTFHENQAPALSL